MTEKLRRYAPYLLAGLVALCLLYLATIYCVCYLAPGYGLFDDDGIYLVTAKSLAQGTGYNIVSLPSAIPQTKYPPVFPVLLAGIWKIYPHFPQNMLALKLVPFLSTLGWLWFSYLALLRMSASQSACRCIILLTAAVPWVVCLSVTLMSEMTFACLLSATLLVFMRLDEENISGTINVLFASGITGAAILTRSAGLPLLLAGTLTLLFQRRIRQASLYLFASAALILPWFAWTEHSQPPPNSIEAFYSGLNYRSWNLFGNFTWQQRLTVVLENFYFMLVTPGYLIAGFKRPAGWEAACWILLILLLAFFSVYGLLLYLSRGVTPVNLFVLGYGGLLLLWVFPPFRFLIPLLPFLLFFCYIAITHFLGTVVRSPVGARAVVPCCVLIIGSFLARGLLYETRDTIRYRAATLPFRLSYDWNEVTALSRWISQSTPETAVLAGDLDAVWFLSTGRKSVRSYVIDPYKVSYSPNSQNPLGTYPEFAQNLLRERATYLIRTREGADSLSHMIDQLASDYPEAVTLRQEGKNSDYRIYQIDRDKLAGDLAKTSQLLPTADPAF